MQQQMIDSNEHRIILNTNLYLIFVSIQEINLKNEFIICHKG